MAKEFSNNPQLKGDDNEGKIKVYSHQQVTIEHYGFHATIKENGKVKLISPGTRVAGTDDYDYDEIEIPASLVFKLAMMLRATRTIKYVNVEE